MTEEKKSRAPRKPNTEFGISFKSFVQSVNNNKLSIMVGQIIGDSDREKVSGSISNVVRKASQNSGVVSARSKDLVEAILTCVVELDPDLEAKAKTLRKGFRYEAIASSHRDTGANWIVRLKAGDNVAIRGAYEGDALYKLVKVGEFPVDAVDEAETDGEVEVDGEDAE